MGGSSVGDGFGSLRSFLQYFKNLTADEAEVFVKILLKGGKVTAAEVTSILKDLDKGRSAARPYILLESLEAKKVLFRDTSKEIKTYVAIHPRDLLIEAKETIDTLDAEIARIDTAREIKSDELDSAAGRNFESVLELSTWINEMIAAGYSAKVLFNKEEFPIGDRTIKKLSETCGGNVIENSISAVLIWKDDSEGYATIMLSKIIDVKKDNREKGITIVGKKFFEHVTGGKK